VGALGIGNLCTQERHRKTLMQVGALEPLCTLARSEDIELEIQRYAVLAIANLASEKANHPGFVEEGMLPLLISLSNVPDQEVRQYAAFAIVKIAQNSNVRKQVTEEGGLEPVLYLARTDEPEIQREIIPALCCLSFSTQNKVDICKFGGLPPVIAALREPNQEVARLASCTLANLSEEVENMDKIVDANALPPLLLALSQSSPIVQREAARCLGNLAANIESVYNSRALSLSSRGKESFLSFCPSSVEVFICDFSTVLKLRSRLLPIFQHLSLNLFFLHAHFLPHLVSSGTAT